MKKIILLISVFVAGSLGLQAQSLALFQDGLSIENNSELVVFNTPDHDPIEVSLVVSNFGSGDMNVKVRRYDLSLVENTQLNFCWGAECYSPFVFESPEAVLIPLGGSNSSFRGDYKHLTNEGTSRARFTFFDVDNIADSTSVIIEYQIYTVYDHSFELTIDGHMIANDQQLSMLINPDIDPVEVEGIIKNVNNISTSIKIKKYDLSLVSGANSNICWGSCYGPDVFDTPTAIVLAPGASDDTFRGDYKHGGRQGTSSVRFTIYNTENINDSLSFVIHYQIGYLGLNEKATDKVKISNAYPNPASTQVNLDYNLPATAGKAQVKITNLLGTTVYDQSLEKKDGKLSIDVSNFNDGIYFYSLILNNTATTTRKFVVKR